MKTTVSVPDDLFAEIDRFARTTGRSRSELYSAALREYLNHHQPDVVTAALDRVVAVVGASSEGPFVKAAAHRRLHDRDW